MALAAVPLGIAIGIAVGLLGGGGSVLAVPILVYILGQDVETATTISLIVVTAAAIAGGYQHAVDRRVCWRHAGAFTVAALPGIIAAMIFAFTVSWAAFVYPMAFLYSSDQQVLTVGTVTSLIRGDVYKWGMLMAGALLAAAPPLVIYAFLMDYYIAGLTAGATKG